MCVWSSSLWSLCVSKMVFGLLLMASRVLYWQDLAFWSLVTLLYLDCYFFFMKFPNFAASFSSFPKTRHYFSPPKLAVCMSEFFIFSMSLICSLCNIVSLSWIKIRESLPSPQRAVDYGFLKVGEVWTVISMLCLSLCWTSWAAVMSCSFSLVSLKLLFLMLSSSLIYILLMLVKLFLDLLGL
jgi:hypothetical protein